jgi:elongation factor 2
VASVVMTNKIGHVILQRKLDGEEVYQKFKGNIEDIHVLLTSFHDDKLGQVQLDQRSRSILFGSGLRLFGFTLRPFV